MVVIYAINAHPIDREEEKAGEKDVAIPKPRQDPVHHIVAKADPRAAEARKILRDVGIEQFAMLKNPLSDINIFSAFQISFQFLPKTPEK